MGFELVTKRTCKRVFLDEMNPVLPWADLVGYQGLTKQPEATCRFTSNLSLNDTLSMSARPVSD